MPANLTPEYKAAEADYRAARDVRSRIEALETMLRVIPKHKGTDHLRGALRKKLSQLKDEAQQERKAGKRIDLSYVPPQGAGQVVLLGPPNSGKSALLDALTNAEPEVAAYPFTTNRPLPGMMVFENIQIQLVDSPAVSRDRYEGWISSLVRRADALLLVVDPSHPDALDDVAFIIRRLEQSKVQMEGFFGHRDDADGSAMTEGELSDEQLLERLEPGVVRLPVILVATKQDLPPRAEDTEALVELLEAQFPIARTSVATREGLGDLAARVFDMLGVVRVYTKPPNKEANLEEPSILSRGSTLEDLARSIHKDLARYLTFARIWGEGYHDGQRIGRDHRLEDGDIVEIHD